MDIKEMIYNFFGMSIEKQIEFIEEVKNNKYASNNWHVIFVDTFSEYYKIIKSLLNSVEEYSHIKGNFEKYYLRKKTLEDLEWRTNIHTSKNSPESIKEAFINNNSIYYPTKEQIKEVAESYYNPKIISNQKADTYINIYKNMTIGEKNKYLEIMCKYYSSILYMRGTEKITNPQKIINSYKKILLNLLGPDLYRNYDDKLYPKEKIDFINCISKLINEIYNKDELLIIEEEYANPQIDSNYKKYLSKNKKTK